MRAAAPELGQRADFAILIAGGIERSAAEVQLLQTATRRTAEILQPQRGLNAMRLNFSRVRRCVVIAFSSFP